MLKVALNTINQTNLQYKCHTLGFFILLLFVLLNRYLRIHVILCPQLFVLLLILCFLLSIRLPYDISDYPFGILKPLPPIKLTRTGLHKPQLILSVN
jgi:hypothetical protein